MELVQLTMIGGPDTEPIFVNPLNVAWVQRTAPDARERPGSVLHLVGQPTLPIRVVESVDDVVKRLTRARRAEPRGEAA